MNDEPVRESERANRRAEALERVRSNQPKRVRLIPRDDVIRKSLKHPASGGFLTQGSIEWPLDQFTKRRLRDGDVMIESENTSQEAASQEAAPQEAAPQQAAPVRRNKTEPPPTS